MQKKHTENIQELLEDTNVRLAKMEAEYNARSKATVSTGTGVCVCVQDLDINQDEGSFSLVSIS